MNDQQTVPTYIINLQSRPDRKNHIIKEFEGRKEFKITLTTACAHEIGAVGLWNSITAILSVADQVNSDLVLICEDDQQFTDEYTRDKLFKAIEEARQKEADILLGGVSGLNNVLQVSEHIYWIDKFSGTQFMIIFRRFFKKMLNAQFTEEDNADYKISSLSKNIYFTFPFISIQKDFGYSDITSRNNKAGKVTELFNKSAEKVQTLRDVAASFQKKQTAVDQALTEVSLDQITLPTYSLNPPGNDRTRQFEGKEEFAIKIIESHGWLWSSIQKIIRLAEEADDDFVVICREDHAFTEHYTKESLIKNIIRAFYYGADLLCGNTRKTAHIIPVTNKIFWINPIESVSFLVVYNKLFAHILDKPGLDTIPVEILLSEITNNAMVLFPFISFRRGLSDAYSGCYHQFADLHSVQEASKIK